jgi:hypothetical protein
VAPGKAKVPPSSAPQLDAIVHPDTKAAPDGPYPIAYDEGHPLSDICPQSFSGQCVFQSADVGIASSGTYTFGSKLDWLSL